MGLYADLFRRRELLLTLVKRDLKVRYKASSLGFLWSFGRPLFLMLIMWAVFSQIVKIETDIPYPLHLLTGILPWFFLAGGLGEAQNAILANGNVVKKVAIPTAVFPAATVLSHLVHLLLALLVLFVFVFGYSVFSDAGVLPDWEIVLLPLIMVQQAAMLLGLALLLSSLNVYYRDVSSISEILLSAWFYLTPVIYPVQLARGELQGMFGNDLLYYLYLCNPMTPIVVAYRRVVYGRYLRHAPEVSDTTLLLSLGVSLVFTVVICVVGALVFRRLSSRFADEL